jgi:subtilisin family serine protease
MKKLIPYLLLLGILINNKLYSQYKTDEIWISSDDIRITLQSGGVSTSNIPALNTAMTKYKTNLFQKVFPYSKVDQLKKLYQLKFTGDQTKLMEELKLIPEIKEIIKRRVENQIAMYDPSDYMWYVPSQSDPNGWLWHLKRIEAGKAWDITKGSPSIIVATIDTWFDINHPDLTNQINPKYDLYDNTPYTTDASYNNHGTTAASFIAAETDGGGQLAGIGFKCRLIAYQAWAGNYLQRAQHAALQMHANVITSSAGGWSCTATEDPIEKLAVQEILDAGTIIVFPAGNGAGTHCEYTSGGVHHSFKPLSPDYDERVILVSSTGKDDKHFFSGGTHSNFPEVDVCAPGYDIMGATCSQGSTWPYYGSFAGTSFSTPIVAGICGLMKTVNPCISTATAQKILKATTDPIVDASSYPGTVGTGRVNAYKAVMGAFSPISIVPLNAGQTIDYVESATALTISGTLINRFYLSQNTITCNAVVNSGVTVAEKSAKSVTLNPGFLAASGSRFHAFIQTTDCSYSAYRPEKDPDVVVVNDVKEDKIEKEFSISCYPNPFADNLTIDIMLDQASSLEVNVYDIFGKSIEQISSGMHTTGKHTFHFDNGALAAGMYIIKVDAGNNHYTKKIVKSISE